MRPGIASMYVEPMPKGTGRAYIRFRVSWIKRMVNAGNTRYDRLIAEWLERCDFDSAREGVNTGESR
jgi:hypothetical protein